MAQLRAILGPTASGKSSVADQVVDALLSAGRSVEVVAIDAFTIYRGMDIGTAKPDAAVRARVPHHLVDVLDPGEEVTVAWFQRRARRIIADIRARDAIALLVGGSGLYWRAVVDDLRFPPTDERIRAALEDRYLDAADRAYEVLRESDPDAAAGIDPHNVRRTIRALEVLELTGERFSSFQQGWDRPADGFEDVEVAYLEPPTEQLRGEIHARAERMVTAGLVSEAAALRTGTGLSRTAAQAIGYAEAFEVLDGVTPHEDLAARIASRTWRYAKRQRSWFRADRRCVAVTASDARARLSRP